MKTLKRLLVTGLLCSAMLFTVTACNDTPDNYAVFAAPTIVQEDYDTFSWAAVEGATGYVIDINGEQKGIGNPVSESMVYGKVCGYVLDTNALGKGTHKIKFAAYKYDEKEGSTLSEWSKEFYVVNEAPNAISTFYIQDGRVRVDAVNATGVKLVFNDSIEATFATPDSSYIDNYTYIPLEKFTFSEELIPGVLYEVKAYAVNNFGVSETAISNTYNAPAKDQAVSVVAVNTQGVPNFILSAYVENPLVALKINDEEYKVFINDDISNIYLSSIISYLDEKSALEVYDAIISDYTASLKVISATGVTVAGEYSNEVACVGLGEAFLENVDNCEVTLSGTYLEIESPVYDSEALKDVITIEVAVVNEDGSQTEIEGIVSGDEATYDFKSALKFGLNEVVVIETINLGGFEKVVEVASYNVSINPQVENVALSGNSVNWTSNGINDGYKVQIVDSTGSVVDTYETTSYTWDTEEFENSATSFSVKVVPVLNGEEGVASPVLKVGKAYTPSFSSVFTENYDNFVISAPTGVTLKVEFKTAGSTVSQNIGGSNYNDEFVIDKSNVYNYNAFEITIKAKGNGINTVDGNVEKASFVISDCLTFDVKGGEKVKVSGISSESIIIDDNDNYYDDYIDSDGWFAIKEYADWYGDKNVKFSSNIGNVSTSSNNVIIKPLYINLNSSSYIASAPSSYTDNGDDYGVIYWNGDNYTEYAYEIYKDDTLVDSGSITGACLDVGSKVGVGFYTVKVKTLGNGQILNSYPSTFYYEEFETPTVRYEQVYNSGTKLYIDVKGGNIYPTVYKEDSYYSNYYSTNTDYNTNEYYVYLDSSNSYKCPVIKYSWNYESYSNYFRYSLPSNKYITNLTEYAVYNYDYSSSNYTVHHYAVSSSESALLRPVLKSAYYGNYYVLSSKPVKTYNDYFGYYDVRSAMDASYYSTPSSSVYLTNTTYYRITFDYTNASSFAGFAVANYNSNINSNSNKVLINYAYIEEGTNLYDYLNSCAKLSGGYKYYVDYGDTQLTRDNADYSSVYGSVTVYVK